MIIDEVFFKGHPCFKSSWSGFSKIKSVNVIIGRNNSGKSHLLDLVKALCEGNFDGRGWQYRCRGVLDMESLKFAFPEHTSGGYLGGEHWSHHGRHFVDVPVTWETDAHGNILNEVFPENFQLNSPYGTHSTEGRLNGVREILKNGKHRLAGKSFRMLLADRDVTTELSDVNLELDPGGEGSDEHRSAFHHYGERKVSERIDPTGTSEFAE